MTTVAILAISTCDNGWFHGPSPSRSTGNNAKGMVNEGGVANHMPRKQWQGVRENSTFWKQATINVVACFCLFSTLLTTIQSNVHALNGNDDDNIGQTAARWPKWQPGGPYDVCTRPTQPREWEAHLPHKHQLQTPTWHFRQCGGATTQQCYVKWYEAMENWALPCWVTWRCRKPNAQCPPVKWHKGESQTQTCRMIWRCSKPKLTNWMTQRHSNPPHSNDMKEWSTPHQHWTS